MFLSWLTLNFVVHKSGNIVLQTGPQLINSSLVSTSSHMSVQLYVDLEYLLVSISKIILTSISAGHGDTWSHRRRGHSKILNNHVLWAGDRRIET